MKTSIKLGLASAVAALSVAALAQPAFAATTSQQPKKQIEFNGQSFASVNGIVQNGTTYMPIWYMMQLLTKMGISNHWDGSTWSLQTSTPVQVQASKGSGKAISVNGVAEYHVDSIVSGGTTYMPAWYIMQILNQLKVTNHWDGTSWTISGKVTQNSGASSGSGIPAGSAGSAGTSLPNAATDDSSYWQRADHNFYISQSTADIWEHRSGSQLIELKPGQTITLMAFSDEFDTVGATWVVNSPDATVSTSGRDGEVFNYNGHKGVPANFTATKPGIYTVQAEVNGKYSQPSVIIVGMSQLKELKNLTVSGDTTGILPLPSGLTGGQTATNNGVTYTWYPTQNGWLPIKGTAQGVTSVEVDVFGGNNQDWAVRLPVTNGAFSGMVRIPFTGSMLPVMVVKNINQNMTSSHGISGYGFGVSNSVSISRTDKALLYTAEMDPNMSANIGKTASILMSNSPSKDTGIVAISNYVSEMSTYDFSELQPGVPEVWHDAATFQSHPLGVCQDFAEWSAALYKSIGIPAETVMGAAPASGPENHEWVQAYDGAQWVITDPTWDQNSDGTQTAPTSHTNQYNFNSDQFQSSHKAMDIGTWK